MGTVGTLDGCNMDRGCAGIAAVDHMTLPILDDKQFAFVMALKAGKSASDAYRQNFDVSTWQPNSVWCAASKLKTSTKVVQWLEHLAKEDIPRAIVSHEEYIGRLIGLGERAEAAGNYGAAAMCAKTLGQTSGHHTERVEVVDNRTEEQLRAEWVKLKAEAEREGLLH